MAEVIHPSGAFSAVVPDNWTVDFTVGGTEMIAYSYAGRFDDLAELAVFRSGEAPTSDWSLADHAEGIVSLWTGGRVIDFGEQVVAGRPLKRVVATHFSEGLAVTVEDWTVESGDELWTLALSCASVSYDRFADIFGDVVASFRVHSGSGDDQ